MRFRRRSKDFDPAQLYVHQPYNFRYDPVILPAEPWRALQLNVRLMPLELLRLILDPERTNQLKAREALYLQDLAHSLLSEGIQVPLELYVDTNNKIRLQEGHHRMIVFLQYPEHFPMVPVTLQWSTGVIRGWGRTLSSLTVEVLDLLSEETERRVSWLAELDQWSKR